MRALLERMQADGVTIAERNDEAAYVAFKCLDPDGHRIEVYWEPLRSRQCAICDRALGRGVSMTEYRVSFDAAIRFSNGGDLTAHGFRVDVPSPDIGRDGIAALFGSPAYAGGHHFLTRAGAAWLAAHDAALAGIDAVNIDDTADGERPAHTLLLAAGIPVVEHLTGLAQLPPTGAWFTAVPLRIEGLGTMPVRAFARLPGLPRSHRAIARRNGTLVWCGSPYGSGPARRGPGSAENMPAVRLQHLLA